MFIHNAHERSEDTENDLRFLNVNKNITALACGAIDPLAMHEALPPTEEKWVTQIWIRQRRTANNAGLGTALEMPAPAPA